MILSEIQKKAVAHKDGAMLVLAGPGSGKTAVITARTQYLIAEHKVTPSAILVVTFTRAAAGEMKERFLRMTGTKQSQVTFGTFHGIFFGILKQAYGIDHRNILSEQEKTEIIRFLLQQVSLETADEEDLMDSVKREIGVVKTNRIDLAHYYSNSCPDENFRELYQQYHKVLRERRKLDFDDLLVYCYDLFQKREDILKLWQDKFRYILVDEFQDINQIQYDIVKMLASPQDNLFAVGDDDQSIYRFRGARPEIMFQFTKDFPQAQRLILDRNYRSAGNIIAQAQRVIKNNKTRFEKQQAPHHEKGEEVEIRSFEDQLKEASYLIKMVRKYHQQGCPYEDMAILFRTNTASRFLVSRLMEYQIPFVMRDTLPNLYEHWIARNMVSYMILASGGRQRKDFLAVMNRPNRYISREALYEKEFTFEELYQHYEEKEWMCDRIELMESQLRQMRRMAPFAAINFIRHGIGYDEYLKEYAQFRRIKSQELLDILDEIQESSKPFKTAEQWFQFIKEYTEELKQQAQNRREQKNGITISTLHSAKGLEFAKVFILDVNEGMIPYHKAVLDAEIEEERRMFYVGMTRAKQNLHLYYADKKHEKAQEPSRFIKEITGEQTNDRKKGYCVHN